MVANDAPALVDFTAAGAVFSVPPPAEADDADDDRGVTAGGFGIVEAMSWAFFVFAFA
jgi:hypothetical protein